MPFVEQEAGQTTETTIDGRKVPVINPKVIVTVTHKDDVELSCHFGLEKYREIIFLLVVINGEILWVKN